MAVITSDQEVAELRHSGQIAAQALAAVVAAVKPGVSTAELNKVAEDFIVRHGGRPCFKGYDRFPAGLCTSVNDAVVHGIPSKKHILRTGDVIGLDIGVEYHGLFSDHAVTVGVGKIAKELQQLLSTTKEALTVGIAAVKPGQRIGDIGAAIEEYIRPFGYGIVTQLTGHGVGKAVHEPPVIANVGKPGTGPVIVPGMVLAIEPMITLGGPQVETAEDGWTVVTADHQTAAHFEHTVMVTHGGSEIITQP